MHSNNYEFTAIRAGVEAAMREEERAFLHHENNVTVDEYTSIILTNLRQQGYRLISYKEPSFDD